jgi:hypothetical protein
MRGRPFVHTCADAQCVRKRAQPHTHTHTHTQKINKAGALLCSSLRRKSGQNEVEQPIRVVHVEPMACLVEGMQLQAPADTAYVSGTCFCGCVVEALDLMRGPPAQLRTSELVQMQMHSAEYRNISMHNRTCHDRPDIISINLSQYLRCNTYLSITIDPKSLLSMDQSKPDKYRNA